MAGAFQFSPPWRTKANGAEGFPDGSHALRDLPTGSTARVQRIDGGHRLLNRLLALGIARGVQLRVLRNPRHGPLLLLVHNTRVALGRGQAAKLRAVPETVQQGAAQEEADHWQSAREGAADAAE